MVDHLNTLNNFLYSKCIYYNNTNPNGDVMKLNKMVLSDVHTYLLNNSKNINNFNNNNQKHVKINDEKYKIHENDFKSYDDKPRENISFEKPMDNPILDMKTTLANAQKMRDNQLYNITGNYTETDQMNAKKWLNVKNGNSEDYSKGPPLKIGNMLNNNESNMLNESDILNDSDMLNKGQKNINNSKTNDIINNNSINNFLSKLKTTDINNDINLIKNNNIGNNNEPNNIDMDILYKINNKLDIILERIKNIETNNKKELENVFMSIDSENENENENVNGDENI